MVRLGGRCGIPDYDARVYVSVTSTTHPDGHVMPLEIDWPDGRRFPIAASGMPQSFGRWEDGNLVIRWEVELVHRARRELFWERGRWFVPRRPLYVNGERGRGEPIY